MVNDGLYADLITITMRPMSRRPLYRGKHNHYVTVIQQSVCKCKHNYQKITVNDTSIQR